MNRHVVLMVGTVVAVLLAARSTAIMAQSSAMANADVVKMVKAGLSEEIVISAIDHAPEVRFDTTATGLTALKSATVSEKIIATMITRAARASATAASNGGQVVIPDGTEVRLRLVNTVSSVNARVDDRVRFEAGSDVVIDGKIVIATGAPGVGTITEAQPKKSFGRRGHLNFTIDSVKSVDGQNIRLRAAKKVEGDESYVKAGVVTYLAGPFGALVKGKDVEIVAGTEYTIFIDGDRRINLKAATSPN